MGYQILKTEKIISDHEVMAIYECSERQNLDSVKDFNEYEKARTITEPRAIKILDVYFRPCNVTQAMLFMDFCHCDAIVIFKDGSNPMHIDIKHIKDENISSGKVSISCDLKSLINSREGKDFCIEHIMLEFSHNKWLLVGFNKITDEFLEEMHSKEDGKIYWLFNYRKFIDFMKSGIDYIVIDNDINLQV